MEPFRLDSKVAIITGGGVGIGRSMVHLFASRGATVHCLDIDPKLAEESASICVEQGYQAYSHECDVASKDNVAKVFETIIAESKRVDILVNNAAIAHVGSLLATTEEDFDKVFKVNVKGVFFCSQEAVKTMHKQSSGVILNIDSIAAIIGLQDRFAYSMSKGAVLSMTYSIAKDYIASGIRCNCICPARVHTPFVDGFLEKNYAANKAEMFKKLSEFQPIGRMAKPEEIAHLALYLCSPEAGFITGSAYAIDGGVLHLR